MKLSVVNAGPKLQSWSGDNFGFTMTENGANECEADGNCENNFSGTQLDENGRIAVGAAWSKGTQDVMQDALAISLGEENEDVDFVGVFDGQGPNGRNFARYAAYRVLDYVYDSLVEFQDDFGSAIQAGFLRLDSSLKDKTQALKNNQEIEVRGGALASTVWVTGDTVYSANLGNSKILLSYDGRSVRLSKTHSFKSRTERRRVRANGEQVSNLSRDVDVTRSFGHYRLKKDDPKKQALSALPAVRSVAIDDKLDFFVVASRGVWQAMEEQALVDLISDGIRESKPLKDVAKEVVDKCTAKNEDSDNVTVAIGLLK